MVVLLAQFLFLLASIATLNPTLYSLLGITADCQLEGGGARRISGVGQVCDLLR